MITPRTVTTKLAGHSFNVEDETTGRAVRFEIPAKLDRWPRGGLEGTVFPVICHHPKKGQIPSILKCFEHEIPQRSVRFRHLVKFGLASVHDWLYEGVPYTWIDNINVNGEKIYGHVSKHVCYDRRGDDFRIIRDSDYIDDISAQNRREIASQLCNAVNGLENLGLVHGDLSPANIIIGKKSSEDIRCIIIDYDGFNCNSVPKLPRLFNNVASRPLGTQGYQHPIFMRRSKQDTKGIDDNLIIESDRFALAVLCCEIMTWTSHLAKTLDRTTLLEPSELEKGRMEIPNGINRVWPDGIALLQAAIDASDMKSLPSPRDWLKALGFLKDSWKDLRKSWLSYPVMSVYKVSGNQRPHLVNQAKFDNPHGGKGGMSILDKSLSMVRYDYKNQGKACSKLDIQFDWDAPIVIKRAGMTVNIGARPEAISISPGDVVLSNGWMFEFKDARA